MQLKNVLPEEILLEIFSEIDKSELRKLFEISSEWRNLLIRNVKVMRKLPLILMDETWSEKMKFVEKYGKYIRQVEFVGTILESFEDVLKVLRLTPNIEKLSLINVKLTQKEIDENSENEDRNGENIPSEKLLLHRLVEFVVEDDENVGSVKFIASHCDLKLKSLKLSLKHEAQVPAIEQFLIESSHLKTLEIFTTLDEVFNPSDECIERMKLQLNKLEVKASVMKYNEQFIKFLKSQSHLRAIALIAQHVDFRYHRMMFTTFPSMKAVHLNIDALGTTDCLKKLLEIPPNKSLQSLKLSGKNLHLNIFDTILKLCPRINQLNVRSLAHFYSDKIKALPLTHFFADCAHREYLNPENMTYLNKLQFTDISKIKQNEIYERNLQNFGDLNGFDDKIKNGIEAS